MQILDLKKSRPTKISLHLRKPSEKLMNLIKSLKFYKVHDYSQFNVLYTFEETYPSWLVKARDNDQVTTLAIIFVVKDFLRAFFGLYLWIYVLTVS